VARAAESMGRPVDILINCAGGSLTPRPFLESDWDEVQQALDMHLKGAWNCCKAVAPGMVQRKSGCVVNVGSIVTWQTPPAQWSAFGMAKAALKALTRSLAHHRDGIDAGDSGAAAQAAGDADTAAQVGGARGHRADGGFFMQ
jgi:NAD(P)-dependent dehydrogenase (short-subunit alcohol dehydrogenase family)